jgi:hypothetical protein
MAGERPEMRTARSFQIGLNILECLKQGYAVGCVSCGKQFTFRFNDGELPDLWSPTRESAEEYYTIDIVSASTFEYIRTAGRFICETSTFKCEVCVKKAAPPIPISEEIRNNDKKLREKVIQEPRIVIFDCSSSK